MLDYRNRSPDADTPPEPTKIVCVGRNYRRHAEELGNAVPEEPLIFLKPPSALCEPDEPIRLPPQSDEVHHEAELAVVIGRRASRIAEEEADEHIAGYTCANDVTARDLQRADKTFTRGKGFDTFCPVGPALVTPEQFDPADHTIECRVDGQLRQSSPLDDFIFSVPTILAYISDIMTLQPGDLVLTGTPAGVGPIEAGQQVDVEVDGIGTLSNPVVER
jgi:2-keto-4-pentenoate hydratase/2-oxohepta-3-ene-1,7-dioic acid hydratase in catechol pathway